MSRNYVSYFMLWTMHLILLQYQKANSKINLLLTYAFLIFIPQNVHLQKLRKEKGGTILYISDKLHYKRRKDLEIYQKKELESTFVEIINKKSSNEIVGVVYRHPNMDTNVFTDDKLTNILHILSREKNKKIYITGDFNFLTFSNMLATKPHLIFSTR